MIAWIIKSLIGGIFSSVINGVKLVYTSIFGTKEQRLENKLNKSKKRLVESQIEVEQFKARTRHREEKVKRDEKWATSTRREKYDLLKDKYKE
jgi:hypothetical protein